MKRWYVAYTQRGAENLAEGQIQSQGFRTYLPRYLKSVRHARTVKDIVAPLFPRYLFVEFDPELQRWRSINGTRGVSYLLSSGGLPTPVPHGVVDEIKAREAQNSLIEIPAETPYETGESLQITAGALADQVGQFIRVDARQRVVMLLELLGREVEIRLPRETVRAYV